MDTSLYVGLSRQVALTRELEVVAHNIANMNTVAFRAERTLFDEAMAKAGSADPVAFVIDRATYTDTRPGALVRTESDLDVALRGEGWISVEGIDGAARYTRDGRLAISPDGVLTNLNGQPVLDDTGAPVFLPPNIRVLDIGRDGTLTADGEQIGRIGIFEFENTQTLKREEGGLYSAEVEPFPAANTTLVQGMLEQSNVEPILELTRMLDISKAYQNASRVVQDGGDLKKDAISRIGRPA